MVSEVVKLSNFQFLCWYLMIGVFCHCFLRTLAQLDFGFIRKSSAVIMATVLKFYDPFNFTAPNLEPWSSIGVGPMASPVDLYIKGTRKEEEVIVGGLLSLIALSAANAKNIKSVLDALTEYFQPLKSEVFDQFLFHRSHQQPGEPFDVWLVEL
ncbi:hypothetical protein OUZ56_021660 [Daphnia magna]|uniref:Uncharacterized protein n=1 Tax=Daphnia magna TaxID=35525 RepID=A0ABR0AU60_9CRUS|nr:hypothetical protein OUZ56_021660 [Daphnia magna]